MLHDIHIPTWQAPISTVNNIQYMNTKYSQKAYYILQVMPTDSLFVQGLDKYFNICHSCIIMG